VGETLTLQIVVDYLRVVEWTAPALDAGASSDAVGCINALSCCEDAQCTNLRSVLARRPGKARYRTPLPEPAPTERMTAARGVRNLVWRAPVGGLALVE
jgi:hypothetical protein